MPQVIMNYEHAIQLGCPQVAIRCEGSTHSNQLYSIIDVAVIAQELTNTGKKFLGLDYRSRTWVFTSDDIYEYTSVDSMRQLT